MIAFVMAGLVLQTPPEKSWLDYNSGDIVIRKQPKNTLQLQPHSLQFQAEGSPVEIEYNSRGAVIDGSSIAFTVVDQPDGKYLLQSADVTGNAKLATDTSAQARFQRSRGELFPVPVTMRSTLTAQHLTLAGQAKSDTVTVSSPFVFKSFRQASEATKAIPSPFEEQTELEGSSGMFDLAPDQTGAYDLRTGTIFGPAHYHMVRTEHQVGKPKPVVTSYDLRADRIVIDLAQAQGTITAIGHVFCHEVADHTIDFQDDKVVVTLNAGRQVQSIEGTGNPSETTYYPPPSPPKGGGRP